MSRSHEHNPVKRFFTKREQEPNYRSMRNAVNATCAGCVGVTAAIQGKGFVDHIEPRFKETIRACMVLSCPLHDYRPYQVKRTS